MTDSDFESGLAEAIAFHEDVLAALPHYSHARQRGRHAKALIVLMECRARLFGRRNERRSVAVAAQGDSQEEHEPVIRKPYKD